MKTNRTSPTKRRSKAQMDDLLSAILEIVDAEESAITIRHLFYRLVGQNVIPKTERAYKSLDGHLSRWRKNGEVPWDAFSDSTRWHIQNQTFDGIADALQRARETYRRDLWATQPYYTEVWVEKDAVAGIVSDITSEFGVPLFVCRGFASLSSLYSASLTFKRAQQSGKAVMVYHLGDYDPSGHAAADAIETTFEDVFDVAVNFERIAITRDQIDEFDLPTRPTKKSDSRAKNWSGEECVELDSMPPAELRQLVEDAIVSRIDQHAWKQIQKIEREEQKTLKRTLARIAA
jgi:hypothetical protein